MLKSWSHDGNGRDMSSLVSSRNALRFLYDESMGFGNADISLMLGEALRCSDMLIAEGQELAHEASDAALYFHFLRAILGLHPEKIEPLVAFLEWLEIIPRENHKHQGERDSDRTAQPERA